MAARRLLLPSLLAALATACGAADAGTTSPPDDTETPIVPVQRIGGPLANAGPDRQVLEGQTVRLDAGSSQRGEASRPLGYLWTVEPDGLAPLSIDDPTARRIRVVAPVLPDGVDRADVHLRLRVDDGIDRAEDRVRLEVVRGPSTAIAPVASAGPDRQVAAGDAIVVGPRPGDDAIVDPTCVGECPAPEVTWTLVEGRGATLEPIEAPSAADGCVPPCARVQTDAALANDAGSSDVVAVLSYRVDVVSTLTGLAAAPDFVRLFVTKNGNHLEYAPDGTLAPPGPWYVGTALPQQVDGKVLPKLLSDPLPFRPVLGEAAPVPGQYGGDFYQLPPDVPSLLGWVFEGQRKRLRSGPRFLLVDWRGLGAGAPTADAGPDPVHVVDGAAVVPDGCDRVRLLGAARPLAAGAAACAAGRLHPDVEFCWTQTHGPPALAGVPASCGTRADAFDSGSHLAGCDSDLACPDVVVPPPAGDAGRVLAFQLQVRRRAQGDTPASAWSVPDTAAIRVLAGNRDDPPAVRLGLFRRLGDGSLVGLAGAVRAGDTVVVDASGSVDPEGRPLSFAVAAIGDGPAFAPYVPCALEGACFAAVAPAVATPTTFPFAITVTAGETATACGAPGGGGVCLDPDGRPIDAPAFAVDVGAAP